MSTLLALGVALIAGCGVYMILSRQLVRVVLGVATLSAAVNLAIFLAGRVGASMPPVMGPSETVLPATAANPLPQALILTAIVIGFALVAFLSAAVLAAHRAFGTLEGRDIDAAERLGDPFGDDR